MTWELTPELEDEILEWIEEGKGLNAYQRYNIANNISRPSRSTILKWQRERHDFRTKCAYAREACGELAAENLDDINAKVECGILKADAAKVISSNLQWKASKLSRVYNDKIKLVGGDENDQPIQIKAEQELLSLPIEDILAINEILNYKPIDSEEDE